MGDPAHPPDKRPKMGWGGEADANLAKFAAHSREVAAQRAQVDAVDHPEPILRVALRNILVKVADAFCWACAKELPPQGRS